MPEARYILLSSSIGHQIGQLPTEKRVDRVVMFIELDITFELFDRVCIGFSGRSSIEIIIARYISTRCPIDIRLSKYPIYFYDSLTLTRKSCRLTILPDLPDLFHLNENFLLLSSPPEIRFEPFTRDYGRCMHSTRKPVSSASRHSQPLYNPYLASLYARCDLFLLGHHRHSQTVFLFRPHRNPSTTRNFSSFTIASESAVINSPNFLADRVRH